MSDVSIRGIGGAPLKSSLKTIVTIKVGNVAAKAQFLVAKTEKFLIGINLCHRLHLVQKPEGKAQEVEVPVAVAATTAEPDRPMGRQLRQPRQSKDMHGSGASTRR